MIHITYGILLFFHIIACIGLIAVILLQAGKGGGLNESFGSATQSLFGAKGNEVLVKVTSGFAIVFLCTSLLLGVLTAKRGRSLINVDDLMKQVQQAQAEGKLPEDLQKAIDEASAKQTTEATETTEAAK